jgi:hypothetical protein
MTASCFAFWIIPAAASCLGCLPPPNDLHGGESLYVAEDSQLLEVLGTTLAKADHRARLPGTPLRVLPAGASVRVAADYEQQRSLMAPGATHADQNPWVLVDVVDSSIPRQRGFKGWIHLGTTTSSRGAESPRGMTPLRSDSLLCRDVHASDLTCNIQLPATTRVRVLACAGTRADVELWREDGLYLRGFVRATQLTTPCR